MDYLQGDWFIALFLNHTIFFYIWIMKLNCIIYDYVYILLLRFLKIIW